MTTDTQTRSGLPDSDSMATHDVGPDLRPARPTTRRRSHGRVPLRAARGLASLVVVAVVLTHWNPVGSIVDSLFGNSAVKATTLGAVEVLDLRQVQHLELATAEVQVPVVYCNKKVYASVDPGLDEFRTCDGIGDAKAVALAVSRSRASIDLSQFDSTRDLDLNRRAGTATVRLPMPTASTPTVDAADLRILSVDESSVPLWGNTLPADWEVTAVDEVRRVATATMHDRLVAEAKTSAQSWLEGLLRAEGIEVVHIQFVAIGT